MHVNANSETFRKTFREALDKPGVVAKEEGDALAAIKTAGKVVEADYEGSLSGPCHGADELHGAGQAGAWDVWIGRTIQKPSWRAAEITVV